MFLRRKLRSRYFCISVLETADATLSFFLNVSACLYLSLTCATNTLWKTKALQMSLRFFFRSICCTIFLGLFLHACCCGCTSRVHLFLYRSATLRYFTTYCLRDKFCLYNADLLRCTLFRPLVDSGVLETVLDTTDSSAVTLASEFTSASSLVAVETCWRRHHFFNCALCSRSLICATLFFFFSKYCLCTLTSFVANKLHACQDPRLSAFCTFAVSQHCWVAYYNTNTDISNTQLHELSHWCNVMSLV